MDTQARSIAKAVSFRMIATLSTMIVIYAITGSLALANIVGAIDFVTKIIIYYFHERLWEKISWGHTRPVPVAVEDK
jgi:uncharacterized membrane protein